MRYVLEGSVRKAGSRVRINAQLIEAAGGGHIWAEKFDRQLDDIFDLQDEITASVAGAVGAQINNAEIERAARRRPADLDAYQIGQKAWWHLQKWNEAEPLVARELALEGIAKDEGVAINHGALALTLANDLTYGWGGGEERASLAEQAMRTARRAIELDPNNEFNYIPLANVLWFTGYSEDALREVRRALELNPNFATAHGFMTVILAYSGSEFREQSAAHFEVFRKLSPRDPWMAMYTSSQAVVAALSDDLEVAERLAREALSYNPALGTARRILIAILGLRGDQVGADAAIKDFHSRVPKFDWPTYLNGLSLMFSREEDFGLFARGFRAAGVVPVDG